MPLLFDISTAPGLVLLASQVVNKANFILTVYLFGASALLGGAYMYVRSKLGHMDIKQVLIYLAAVLVLFALAGLVQFAKSLDSQMRFFILQGLLFMIGTGHAYIYTYRRDPGAERLGPDLLFTLMLAIVGLLGYSVVHALIVVPDDGLAYRFLWAGLAFLLPYLALLTSRYWRNIPARHYRLWYPPADPRSYATFEEFATTPKVTIAYTVQPLANDPRTVTYQIDAYLRMEIAHFFYRTVLLHNKRYPDDAIEVADEQGRRYGWSFEMAGKNFWQTTTHLDFERTVGDNEVGVFSKLTFNRITNTTDESPAK